MPEVYVSTDVEADGPIPGPHSMLSFGSAAFLADGTRVGTFSANLELLPEATGHPETMTWWESQPEAWAACREDPRPPAVVMPEYVVWLKALPGRPVFVGYPAAYDFLFVYWYLIRFAGQSPFSHSALDIKTFAMAMLGTEYRAVVKRRMPARWFGEHPHTHVALDDATGQGMPRRPKTCPRRRQGRGCSAGRPHQVRIRRVDLRGITTGSGPAPLGCPSRRSEPARKVAQNRRVVAKSLMRTLGIRRSCGSG